MLRNVSNRLSLLSFLAFVGSTPVANAQAPTYPPTAKGNVADDYHGQKVADPYRWLEDLGSVDTKAWIDAEKVVDFETTGRTISLRAGDIELSKPFGLATYQTTAALRNIQVRRL